MRCGGATEKLRVSPPNISGTLAEPQVTELLSCGTRSSGAAGRLSPPDAGSQSSSDRDAASLLPWRISPGHSLLIGPSVSRLPAWFCPYAPSPEELRREAPGAGSTTGE
ncbi:unnamed protein product [Pleuronectes platessa]|uniref:Uncharacterized protein n=1 Tax=Pleuronectes platessa TaxID=8262 RepID=A0A9N7UDA0_PLEPL|nr:unnamed protein product [Pleuronectes platessa]